MKWLKMDCDAQENLDMKKLVDEWGWDWYGRYWAIMGKIGMLVTDKSQTFSLTTNNGCPFPVKLLANDLSTTVERLSAFCKYLADNRLIDKATWYKKKLIYAPKLKERADEYTRKLLTKSRHTPDQEVDIEVEVDKNIITHTLPEKFNTKDFSEPFANYIRRTKRTPYQAEMELKRLLPFSIAEATEIVLHTESSGYKNLILEVKKNATGNQRSNSAGNTGGIKPDSPNKYANVGKTS